MFNSMFESLSAFLLQVFESMVVMLCVVGFEVLELGTGIKLCER